MGDLDKGLQEGGKLWTPGEEGGQQQAWRIRGHQEVGEVHFGRRKDSKEITHLSKIHKVPCQPASQVSQLCHPKGEKFPPPSRRGLRQTRFYHK